MMELNAIDVKKIFSVSPTRNVQVCDMSFFLFVIGIVVLFTQRRIWDMLKHKHIPKYIMNISIVWQQN